MSAIQQSARAGPPCGLEVEAVIDRHGAVVRARGEIDIASAPAIEDRVRSLFERGVDATVLDLHAVTFIDAAGIGLLVRLQALADSRPQRRFSLGDRSPAVDRVLDITRLAQQFPLAPRSAGRTARRRREGAMLV